MENTSINIFDIEEYLDIIKFDAKTGVKEYIRLSQSQKDEYDSIGFFPETDLQDCNFEGAKISAIVNRYERSKKARDECISRKGTVCYVCERPLEDTYGELGKDFIHIHHLTPLSEIQEGYVVDVEKDLIPVCPNCHAMLHREINGRKYTWEELRDRLKSK